MSRPFSIKNTFILAMALFIFGLPISQYNIGVQGVFAQEEVIDGDAEGVENAKPENEESGVLQKIQNFFGAIVGWFGNKLKVFTDKIDAAVGVDSDNKGTNALFGLPLYLLVAVVCLFAFKLVFNILRGMLKAIFSGDSGGKPKGRHKR